ncbi:hypothetical protein Y032_0001g459 [Ancylostoma ceylanicum]|uniref:Uncharacterized protein n=1 Tax=Ancylostoma ceylanicum TaxID=53326 RepID=A0A016W5L9_9BILA|nr:hypothetical protein Y032_0001g459 [Ancylostoma ceylanicum]
MSILPRPKPDRDVLEQLIGNAGPLLRAGRAAHAPQALRARRFSTDCAEGLYINTRRDRAARAPTLSGTSNYGVFLIIHHRSDDSIMSGAIAPRASRGRRRVTVIDAQKLYLSPITPAILMIPQPATLKSACA